MELTYEYYQKSAAFLRTKLSEIPKIAIVLGSCLGGFADTIQNPTEIPYGDIPNFLESTAPSHAGQLIFGTVAGKQVVCMSGRFHAYEGYSFQQLTIPIRVLKLLGVETVILTNAAGGVNLDYRPGDVMLLSDHIKLTSQSPMIGKNIPEFGERFFDVSRMYTPDLRQMALAQGKDSGLTIHQGVYMFFAGPQFETPAEIRMARILGADAVGMSTVTEALTACHCGMNVLAMSVITNMAAGVLDAPVTTEEVDETAAVISHKFGNYMTKLVAQLP